MDTDEEDYVFYGTPIERAEDMTSRKKKAVAEAAGQLRALPPWKQEVTDEEGRRRFHGAFTGGFSAGYYNTVGSKEGWTPQTFTSSRKKRAEVKKHDILNFLDDDEKEELEGNHLSTSMQFDTFGLTAAEFARKQADKEQRKRPSAIPGPSPDEILLPATNSIGVKLLLKMGWRHGHSIKDSRHNSLYDARREARKAFLAFASDDAIPPGSEHELNKIDHEGVSEQSVDDVVHTSKSIPVFVLNPKQDMHGLGYDPFKHAPEFRERKRLRVSGNRELGNRRAHSVKDSLFASKSGKVAPGFGIGALEELDDEDEDVYGSGYDFEETYVQDIEEPSRINTDTKRILGKDEQSVLPGFKLASNSDSQMERFDPPVIPTDFEPYHKFSAALEIGKKLAGPPPPEVSPPEDKNLRQLIDGFAALVARCGKLFEDLSKEKHKTNPLFCFLSGGNGHEYYARKLWESQQKHNDQSVQSMDMISVPSVQKMTAESRGRILGEKPLERSSKDSSLSVPSADSIQLQFHLSDTFMKPASHSELRKVTKPFKADPGKQERFERFLKEKYQGGLRSTDSGGNSNMSESDRARERLDFEAAAEAIQKAKSDPSTKLSSSQHIMEISSTNLQFTSGDFEESKVTSAEEQIIKKMYPKREEYQWRPLSILCKRFDIIDPYMGKPPPPPRPRGRIDSLIFTPDFVKTSNAEESVSARRDSLLASRLEPQVTSEQAIDGETGFEPNNSNVEKPVDLYKAIFSDDSDEGEDDSSNQVQDSEKKTEVANTTLNRLIAGDFLESLGKELGLEVPLEPPLMNSKVNNSASLKEAITTSGSDFGILPHNDKPPSSLVGLNESLEKREVPQCSFIPPESIQVSASNENEFKLSNQQNVSRQGSSVGHLKNNSDKPELPIITEGKSAKRHSKRHRSYSSSSSSEDERSRRQSRRYRSRSSSPSSEDERARKHSKRHRSKDSVSDMDSSDEHGSRTYSRSRGKKKGSSRGKSGKKEHSKHRSSGSKDSPSRSSHRGSGREHRKDGRKSGDQGRDLVCPKSDSNRKYR